MNINNRWLTLFTLLLVTANIVTLSLLWIHHKGNGPGDKNFRPPPRGQIFEFVNQELKLDSVQREGYRKLREEHQAGQRSIEDSIKKQKDIFFAMLQQPGIADSAIETGAKRIAEAEQKLELLTFRHFQKVRAICNAAQQKKFDEIIRMY